MKSTVGVLAVVALFGCARGISTFGYDEPGDAGTFATEPAFSSPLDVACTNLQCRQARCGARQPKTTVSGTVYDPAGVTPLYNVIVYVPNAKLEPLKTGATCERCGSGLSGKPIVTALTDTHGRFVLEDVPTGDDVPIVIQIGKWRRQITLPHVEACKATQIDDKEMFRLPRTQSEGDMPRIAVSTGCDPMECLLRTIGIDDSEFTDGEGKGRVHIYRGKGGGGVSTSTSAYAFWQDEDKLDKYDIVINACECQPYPRGPGAYAAMQRYLNKGGRFFGSHYHYNWFTDEPNQSELAVEWTPGGKCNSGPNYVDDSFPKGKAMAEWLYVTGATHAYGQIPLSCAPLDVKDTKGKLAQGWIFDGPTGSPSYVSFNTPIDSAAVGMQCGRAVFADLHVSEVQGDFSGQEFPRGCMAKTLSPQEKALEFMFFDLASCVLDDSDTPTPPRPIK